MTMALTRQVPTSVTQALTHYADTEASSPFRLETARQQHDNYVTTLRRILPTLELPPLEAHPDCLFVEDTVVVIGRHAVLCHPGHPTRRGEVDSIKDVLLQLGLTVTDMRDSIKAEEKNHHDDDDTNTIPFCDGGDVLYTGRHLFVGLSERTNASSIPIFQTAFSKNHPLFEIVPVPLPQYNNEALHLKSIVTHVNDTTLLAPLGRLGDDILLEMKAVQRGYDVIRLPNLLACNVVVLNGNLLAQDGGCSTSRSILETVARDQQLNLIWTDQSELSKIDAALTCCSVLLSI
jgi:dimethylargininase